MKSDIIIWVPMNSKSGFGHFYRMFGFYEALTQDNCNVSYFTNEEYINLENVNFLYKYTNDTDSIISYLLSNSVKIIIIDNYSIDAIMIKRLKQHFKIIYFDAEFKNYNVDILMNLNPFAIDRYLIRNNGTKYFLGLENMVFREALMKCKEYKVIKRSIFINFGGSDIQNITLKLIPLLPIDMSYNIVLGKGCSEKYYENVSKKLIECKLQYSLYQQPKKYFEIVAKSEFAISTCSTTIYELMYLSKAFICVNVIENQNTLTEYLSSKKNMTLSVNELDKITELITLGLFRKHNFKKAEKNDTIIKTIKDLLYE